MDPLVRVEDWGQVPKTPNWQSGPVVLLLLIPGCKPARDRQSGRRRDAIETVMPLTAAAIPWVARRGLHSRRRSDRSVVPATPLWLPKDGFQTPCDWDRSAYAEKLVWNAAASCATVPLTWRVRSVALV